LPAATGLAEASDGDAALAICHANKKLVMKKAEAHTRKTCLAQNWVADVVNVFFMKFPNKLARRKSPFGCG
jgi:hypothetical protein